MGPGVIIVGLLIVALTAVDELRTTVGAHAGSGPFARAVFRMGWSAGSRLGAERFPPVRWIGGMGTLVVAGTIMSWFILVWLGWTLVFLGSSTALLTLQSSAHASFVGRVFYAGPTLADLGNAGVRATHTGFQLAVVGEAVSGLVLLTLAITFVGPVISAVANARSLASQISGLGSTAAELVDSLGDCGTSAASQQLLVGLSSQLSTVAQQHRAYPLMVTFSARSSETAVAPSVAALLDAVLLLTEPASGQEGIPPSLSKSLLSSVEAYVSLCPTRVRRPNDPPPLPATGGELPSTAAAAFSENADLRTRALQIVLSSGWTWPVGA
jgi:hypothetical protein